MTVEQIYAEAKAEMNEGNYEAAIKQYEVLQSRYPYGRYAQQALLETAYSYYKQNEPESAISTAERFIKQYPNNQHVDYAYYLRGLANFNGEIGLLTAAGGQDPTERDPKAAQNSFNSFKDLVTRFPDSRYAPDSRLRMHYLANSLAKYELHVAKYYLRRGAYIASANRAKNILSQFPNSPSTRDALEIMIKAYDALGMKDLRDDAQRVLTKNTVADAPSTAGNAGDNGKAKLEKSWWQIWK